MASLMELVERVNNGEMIDSECLEVYQESPNSAEKFLAHHASAMLDLRQAHQHMLQSLEAIDYSDQKVLNQFISVSGFLGMTDMRAAPMARFGSSAIARRECALGMEAIQNGCAHDLVHGGTYTADRESCQFIATQYERAASSVGWECPPMMEWNNKQTRIAYVCSSIADDEITGRCIRSLAKHHDSKRFKMSVYSSECGVRRDRQQFAQSSYCAPSSKRGSQTIEFCSKMKVSCWTCPTDGDSVSAAKDLASQLIKDKIDVVIFDCNQADPICCMVGCWDVCRVQMNLCRRTPMYGAQMDCVIYCDQARWEADKDYWQHCGIDSKFMLEGIDVDEALPPAPQRSSYGIPEQAMVLSTYSNDLDRTLSEEFCETIINILRAHPHAVYLMVGDGEMGWQKRKFESAGVGKRVGYAGRRKDMPGFLRIADLYLCEFPSGSASGVIMAMAMEKPCVAMRCGDSADQSQAAAFVGSEGTITGRDSAAYIERVSKIMREPAYRSKLGKTMRSRIEQHFAYNQTARHLEQLCDQLIQDNTEQSAMNPRPMEPDSREPMAEVA